METLLRKIVHYEYSLQKLNRKESLFYLEAPKVFPEHDFLKRHLVKILNLYITLIALINARCGCGDDFEVIIRKSRVA